jgi:hypothetical protein
MKSYYLDMSNMKLYCFDTLDLYEKFRLGDFINEESGIQFPELFVKEVMSVNYDNLLKSRMQWEASQNKLQSEQVIEDIKKQPENFPLIKKLIDSIEGLERKLIATEPVVRNAPLPPKEVQCEYCKRFTNSAIKSVISDDAKSRLVTFCNTYCLTDWKEPSTRKQQKPAPLFETPVEMTGLGFTQEDRERLEESLNNPIRTP